MVSIVDVLIVVLAVVIIALSAKKGFVAACLDAVSVVAAGFASFKLYEPLSQKLYDFCIRDLVKTSFARALDDMSSSLSFLEKVTGMVNSLPETARLVAKGLGFNAESVMKTLNQSVASDNNALIELVTDKIAFNIMITFTEIIVFMLLFAAICLVIRLVANFFSDNLKKIPVVGSADTLLGGVLGVVKAVVILIVVTTLMYIILSTAKADSPLVAIGDSKLYSFLAGYNPVITFLNK